jgi:exonuclease SbcC
MRPLELRLRNFRSYFGDEATFDFRDRSLVGVVGAIGSGKSSILDAIAFGLYGKTPSVASATKTLIHQRANEAAVALRFEVEGDVYEVVRSLRRKGAGQHALYRYESDLPDAEPVATVTQEGGVNTAIVELLGLEFDAFSRSVLLAQGRFAEFLTAPPSERDKVLKGVFGHDRVDRMREVSRRRAADLNVELAVLNAKAEQFEALSGRLEERREQLEAARQRVELLSKAEPGVVDLEDRIEVASGARDAASEHLEVLHTLRDRLPGETATEALLAEVTAVRARRREAARVLETTTTAAADAEADVRAAEAAGTVEIIETGAAMLAALSPLQKSAAEAEARVTRFTKRLQQDQIGVSDAEKRLGAAGSAAEAARDAVATATEALAVAERELHAARHQDMAASLRAELHAGEPCPVCRQVVEVPPAAAAVDLEASQRRVELARAGREQAEQASARALAEHTSAAEALELSRATAEGTATELDAATKEVETHVATLQDQMVRLAETLGEGDPQVLLDELRITQVARSEAVAAARKAVDRARAAHDTAIRAEQDADKQLATLRVDVVELAGRIGEELEPPGDDPVSVGAALADLRNRWHQLGAQLQQAQAAATADGEAAQRELGEVLDSLGVKAPLSSAIAAADARVELLATEVVGAEKSLEESSATIAARDELIDARERYERITSDLTNSRFIRYLLDDERSRLAELGSEHFERLSSGRYRFTEDGVFNIVDLTAADAVRRADSLSGGETFLASLALALALAEMVTRTGGRLDAFFLDEGFGALDLEHLDLAMEGVEALAAEEGDRLVVVVSHVPELRHRLEDLIELDRDPTTGDTRVLQA